jgi:Rrf2 family protein
MLSSKAKYALRAMLALSRAPREGPFTIAAIAEEAAVPKKFLELILLDLKRHGLIHSRRGRQGGYSLSRAPKTISFGEIVRKIDGPLAAVPCVSKNFYRACEDCVDEKTCEIRPVMARVREATAAILDRTMLTDVMSPRRRSPRRSRAGA